jgi:hypothetical protein
MTMSDEEACTHPNGFGVYGCPCGAVREDQGVAGSLTVDESQLMTVEVKPPSRRVQIVVLHNDETYTYHPVPPGQGWKMVNPGLLLIGSGLGRVHVPLIGVRYFMPEEY